MSNTLGMEARGKAVRAAEELLARDTRRILLAARRKLQALLAEADVWEVSTGRQIRRLDAIFGRADLVIRDTYRKLNELHRARLGGLAADHGARVLKDLQAMVHGVVPGAPTLPIPTRATFRALATSTPVRGEVLYKWWDRQRRTTRERFRDEVRLGYLNGEQTPAIAKRVGTALGVSSRQAEALSRTAVHAIANKAQAATYWANRRICPAMQYFAVIDERTTELCYGLHLKTWRIDDPEAQWPPQHFNCRSTTLPVLDYDALGVPPPEATPDVRPPVDNPRPPA